MNAELYIIPRFISMIYRIIATAYVNSAVMTRLRGSPKAIDGISLQIKLHIQ